MEVLEFPNGICAKHGPKLNVNGVAQCVRCVADAERALRPAGPTVTVEDPGHEAMRAIVPDNKHQPTVPQSRNEPTPVTKHKDLAAIREAIYRLPMPKSLKQYKRFQKIQQLIDQAVEDENAEAD